MAAINDKNKALAALTSAALALPGLNANAAIPLAEPEMNVQYGHYQESDDRMEVDVYHLDFTVPYKDRFEFSFSVDRDTYSGATPAYSLPVSMTNQTKVQDGVASKVDIVTAASQGLSAKLLTIFDLHLFQQFININAPGSAALGLQKQNDIDLYKSQNPQPASTLIPNAITLNFDKMAPSTGGHANINESGLCTNSLCYQEQDFLVGVVSDSVSTNHIHGDFNGFDGTNIFYQVGYHNDSSGIYIRHKDGIAFDVISTDFYAPFNTNGNFRTGNWEILGFTQAANLNLSSGNGTDYPTRTAYQTVNNASSQNGLLTLNSQFQNIKGFWIHFQGAPNTTLASSGIPFKMGLDNLNIVFYQEIPVGPEGEAWQKAFDNFNSDIDNKYKELERLITIAAYRAVLNQITPPMSAIVQRFQYQPLETRVMPTFSGKYYFDDTTLAFSGGYSDEPDFLSHFGSINVSHEFNNKLSTISAGYSVTSNNITRSTDSISHSSTDSSGGGHAHDPNDPTDTSLIYPSLNETSLFHGFNLGFSQVLTKNTLFQTSANYTHQSGYLSNPYKFVYIRGEVTPEEYYEIYTSAGQPIDWKSITKLEMIGLELFREERPDERNQWSFSNRINQHIPALDASLHFDYRFYIDDWGINSHTFEVQWYQNLPGGFTITPSFRYYSQSQADFFAPYFLAPRGDGYYSSDFRLADFGAVSGGITFSKQFTKGIKLDAGFEYYSRQSDLKMGGGLDNSYADYSYYMVHAGLNIDLGAPHTSGPHAHHMHHDHGAPLPAGVMFGHMMNTPGDFMVGYRYMYGIQSGDIWRGTGPVNDALLLNAACGNYQCGSRPTEMTMHMHMLDLMYAPTDWLNLMLMPQIMDMKMSVSEIPGSTVENEHGGGHGSGGLGDTIMAAMVKVVDTPDHDVHVTLGFSAPTGEIETTIDGRDPLDSELQDYGMQLGSGTWDFRPSATYTGQFKDWSWGAQVSGIKRMQSKNKLGYALGDAIQTTAWGSYKILDWLSTSVRGIYSAQGAIHGESNRARSITSTVDYAGNYGGRFWDVGFGLNLTIPSGPLASHNISIEWLQPVSDDFNGYQLERTGTLNATWNFAF